MSPDYASALYKFYCNGCFPFAPAVLPLCDFSPIHFASLVKKCNDLARALFRFGCSIFLVCKAGCKPDVLEGGSVPFCVGPGSSLINFATQALTLHKVASSICIPCKHDSAVHFCQLGVEDDP